MSYESERKLIETMFKAGWIKPDGTVLSPVAYDQQDITIKPESTVWVRLTIASGGAIQASVGSPGSNVARYAGAVAVQISIPSGHGSSEARLLADKVKEIFNNRNLENMRFGLVYSAGSPEPMGSYSTWTIWCPFTRDEFDS